MNKYKQQIDLSIVIPALNEAAIIKDTLQKLHNYLAKDMPDVEYEVIVVAARDKDKTGQIAQDQAPIFNKDQLIVISPHGRIGKGRDVQLGFNKAHGDVQIFTDADLAIPLEYIKPMYCILRDEIKHGKDAAVFGVRSQKHNHPARKVLSLAGNILTRILFVTSITDLQCGFKGFTKGAARKAFETLDTKGWAFDVEVFTRLREYNIPVKALSITKWHTDTHHLGGENLAIASLYTFFEMVKIRFFK